MPESCLSCEEIQQKICDLADEILNSECKDIIVVEGGTRFDYSAGFRLKSELLKTYREMFKMKCSGAGSLYEYVSVPCVAPATCVGTSCRPNTHRNRTSRRYSR